MNQNIKNIAQVRFALVEAGFRLDSSVSDLLASTIDLPRLLFLDAPPASGKSTLVKLLRSIFPTWEVVDYDDLPQAKLIYSARCDGGLSSADADVLGREHVRYLRLKYLTNLSLIKGERFIFFHPFGNDPRISEYTLIISVVRMLQNLNDRPDLKDLPALNWYVGRSASVKLDVCYGSDIVNCFMQALTLKGALDSVTNSIMDNVAAEHALELCSLEKSLATRMADVFPVKALKRVDGVKNVIPVHSKPQRGVVIESSSDNVEVDGVHLLPKDVLN